jgi:hypothetical protein
MQTRPDRPSMRHAHPHPPPVSRTARLLAHLLWRRSRRNDCDTQRQPTRHRPMGMGVRLLSGIAPGRTSGRNRRHLRRCPRRFRASVDFVSIKTHRSRFPGVARSTGIDCREISSLRSRRAHAAGLEAAERRGGLMKSPQGWKRPFDQPIPLPRGRQLVTLKDAANYIQKLPKAEQDIEEWQAAR